jgi:predicted nucleotidyltransferase
MALQQSINVPLPELRDLARRWKIREIALFGSAARGELTPESDIDVAVTFADDAHWSLFEFAKIQLELTDLFGRDVDLVEKSAIRNPFRRRSILRDLTILYAA